MHFRVLQGRLVAHIQNRVRNGEISERSLARLTGISQPHVHNVLKGKRLLSPETADQMMMRLHIDLTDLLTAEDLERASRPQVGGGEYRAVRLLEGWIGPEHPYPRTAGKQHYRFPAADVERLEEPVAARLAPRAVETAVSGLGGVVLLDTADSARSGPEEKGYFALELPDGCRVGLVHRTGLHLYLESRADKQWMSTRLPDGDPAEYIRGRVSVLILHL